MEQTDGVLLRVRRRLALVVVVLSALLAAVPAFAGELVASPAAKTEVEQGRSIDWELAALTVASPSDTLDVSSGLAVAAIGFPVDVAGAGSSPLLLPNVDRQVQSPAGARPSRARAPPTAL